MFCLKPSQKKRSYSLVVKIIKRKGKEEKKKKQTMGKPLFNAIKGDLNESNCVILYGGGREVILEIHSFESYHSTLAELRPLLLLPVPKWFIRCCKEAPADETALAI